jgi:hypothetical protein
VRYSEITSPSHHLIDSSLQTKICACAHVLQIRITTHSVGGARILVEKVRLARSGKSEGYSRNRENGAVRGIDKAFYLEGLSAPAI